MPRTARLTDDQLSEFHEQGYLMVPDLIDADTINAVRDEIDAVVRAEAAKLHEEGLLSKTWDECDFDHQLAQIATHEKEAADELIRRVYGPGGGGHMGPAIFEMIRHPDLLDAIESIVGPEIIGSSVYRIRPKAPGMIRGAVPWHQDSGYLMSHCDREMIVTCWVPLVDSNEENGCLHVIPKAHQRGILEHHTGGSGGYLVINDEDLPQDQKPVAVPVPVGGVLMLTNLTPHGSFLNKSDAMRWSVDLRYQSSGVPNNVDMMPADIDPDGPEVNIACHPPEADFVLRSPSEPEREVKDWRVLKNLRDDYLANRSQLRVVKKRWTPVTQSLGD